ncbi:hypothetical protein DACRYDRAFT_13149 [Dacryopinax primogenitus]|uniref:Methyltransferase type 11 domain-containing protein n=1 Tax=Dacryopinax primogenitus (strain DJM 731) TaxID=1858805 RepID=M5G8H3_DACPD|nr:uncharacterized protein DACRYDRAFT_13149 [Dacryopinax primogenitus]EJU06516.1 hypothetical protein DACRYDRAFT_13149 [Dacryopinax primogenitus]
MTTSVAANPAPQETRSQEERYYTAESYLLPSDEEERLRMEILSLILAREQASVWLNHIAKTVPSTVSLIGADIEDKLFPKPLSNQIFVIQSSLDLPKDWSSRFNLVHQRLMGLAFSSDAWKKCIEEQFRVLKPGGWVQIEEYDILWSLHKDHDIPPYSLASIEGLRTLCGLKNVDPEMYPKIEGLLETAGFVDVRLEKLGIPLVVDGQCTDAHHGSIEAWRGMKGAIVRLGGLGMGKTHEKFDQWLDLLGEEWRSTGQSLPYLIWTGRKPLLYNVDKVDPHIVLHLSSAGEPNEVVFQRHPLPDHPAPGYARIKILTGTPLPTRSMDIH